MGLTNRIWIRSISFVPVLALSIQAVEFPGPAPGPAAASVAGEAPALRNGVLSAQWSAAGATVRFETFAGRLGGGFFAGPAEIFVLETSAGRVSPSDCEIEAPPEVQPLSPDPDALRAADRTGGKALAAVFRHPVVCRSARRTGICTSTSPPARGRVLSGCCWRTRSGAAKATTGSRAQERRGSNGSPIAITQPMTKSSRPDRSIRLIP